MAQDLGSSVASGAAWMVGMRWANRLVGIVSIAFLARLLAPEDFGLVALAMTVVGFLDLFGQTQVDVALIREKGSDRELFDSAWTMEIARGALVGIGLALISGPASNFFSEPRIVPVLLTVAAVQFVGSLQNIGTVAFRKDMRFERDFLFEISSRIAGATLTIVAAYLIRNYWALVTGIALQGLSRMTLSYVLSNYRPRICFRRIREIFHFSKWMLLQNLSYGLREQAPVFAVSRLLNLDALGLFNVAKEISAFVTSELRAPIRRALYPGFARMSFETGALKTGYIDAFGILLLLSLPISVGLYLVSDLVVVLFLGPQWSGAVPLLRILAFLGIIQSFGANTYLVLNRLGQPHINAIAGLGYLAAFLPALFWATQEHGIYGTAWSIVAGTIVLLLTEYAIMRSVMGVTFRDMASRSWRPVLAALVMGITIAAIRSFIAAGESTWISAGLLLILAFAGAIVYSATAMMLWWLTGSRPGAEQRVIDLAGRFRLRSGLVGASS